MHVVERDGMPMTGCEICGGGLRCKEPRENGWRAPSATGKPSPEAELSCRSPGSEPAASSRTTLTPVQAGWSQVSALLRTPQAVTLPPLSALDRGRSLPSRSQNRTLMMSRVPALDQRR